MNHKKLLKSRTSFSKEILQNFSYQKYKDTIYLGPENFLTVHVTFFKNGTQFARS